LRDPAFRPFGVMIYYDDVTVTSFTTLNTMSVALTASGKEHSTAF